MESQSQVDYRYLMVLTFIFKTCFVRVELYFAGQKLSVFH